MTQMVFEQHKFSGGELSQITTAYIDQYPIVYILYNRNEKNRPTAYIGQTVQVDKRMRAHLKDSKRKGLTDTLSVSYTHLRAHET
ncbi:GIY-YIG nuclease family protein, partial [Enterococcus sp. S181_ASV_20]|nr:GIY-YIG nuclease family protein [Enterococcus sp. S181_ASV_20]